MTELLIRNLERVLPNRKEYPSGYLGDCIEKSWTHEELATAFTEELDWNEMGKDWEGFNTLNLRPNKPDIPSTIEDAVRKRYAIERPRPMTEMDSIICTWEALF